MHFTKPAVVNLNGTEHQQKRNVEKSKNSLEIQRSSKCARKFNIVYYLCYIMNRKGLDKLTTKQDFLRPEKLSEEQEIQLKEATKVERRQFDYKKVLTKKDIPKLARVEPTSNIYLANTIENPYLSLEMKKILDEIESRFKQECLEGFFIIISLTRTISETAKLNPKISNDDTHCKGEAIDFAGKFMNKNFPKSAKTLKKILIKMKGEGKIHFLDEEDSTSFWHVCRNNYA